MKTFNYYLRNFIFKCLFFITVSLLFSECKNLDNDKVESAININKINQIISMTNNDEIVLGLNILTREEKAYAWRKTILDKTMKMVLNENQRELVSDVVQSFNDPNIFDHSTSSKEKLKLLSDRAKSLFSEIDYFTIFVRLTSREHLLNIFKKYQKQSDNSLRPTALIIPANKAKIYKTLAEGKVTAPTNDTGSGGQSFCTCKDDFYCYITAHHDGFCYFDTDNCYTDGSHETGCGFTGSEVCEGKCG